MRSGLGAYIELAYLHHGYFFFAPNPGPSHLMDITLYDADGSQRHLRLPNHRAQWPRLLYHRHFMLSEFLNQLYTPPLTGVGATSSPAIDQWRRERAMFEQVRGSMEKHLAVRYGAQRAEIQLMEHRLPNAVEVFDDKLKLDDEKLYILMPDLPPEDGLPPLPASAVGPSSTLRAPSAPGAMSIPLGPMKPNAPTPLVPERAGEEVKP